MVVEKLHSDTAAELQRQLNRLTVCEKSLTAHMKNKHCIASTRAAFWVPEGLHTVRARLRKCGVPEENIHKTWRNVVKSPCASLCFWTSSITVSKSADLASTDAGAMIAGACVRIYGGHLINQQWLALCTSTCPALDNACVVSWLAIWRAGACPEARPGAAYFTCTPPPHPIMRMFCLSSLAKARHTTTPKSSSRHYSPTKLPSGNLGNSSCIRRCRRSSDGSRRS